MDDGYLITPDIFTNKMNILIYGDPGSGKTHLAGTAQDVPEMADVHVFNIDGGIMTLASRGDIHATNIRSVDELEQELFYLKTTREKEVAEQIKEARSFGDLSENSEYDEAKNEQGKLYSRIAEITDLIENAEVVEKVEVAADVVTIGSRVRVLDIDEDVEEEYTIVGSQEANPMEGCISDDSPFGFALKGHKVGETVTVAAPVGELQFKIIAVENED